MGNPERARWTRLARLGSQSEHRIRFILPARGFAAVVIIDTVIKCKVSDFMFKFSFCERFEPRSHFISRLSMVVRVNVVLNRTVVVDSNWRFDNLCGSHLESQSVL